VKVLKMLVWQCCEEFEKITFSCWERWCRYIVR